MAQGIIEDHEARLGVLEASRRGYIPEITHQIEALKADLDSMRDKLVWMEQHHTGIQHSEIDRFRNRVNLVEGTVKDINDRVAEAIGEWEVSLSHLEDAINTLLSSVNVGDMFQSVARESMERRFTAALTHVVTRLSTLEEWMTDYKAWRALPWWKRLWLTLRGKQWPY